MIVSPVSVKCRCVGLFWVIDKNTKENLPTSVYGHYLLQHIRLGTPCCSPASHSSNTVGLDQSHEQLLFDLTHHLKLVSSAGSVGGPAQYRINPVCPRTLSTW
ncbi:hypothetical protein L3X38_007507 [Prunus dulcis]|uniref:Uncharacterized protein n=1 Tax=Prunus dulcis TaxID=3755 RepID=A0AAD4ZUX4_PRUDU|nr:hypothetical protein L3X38_007507 [Prunus dulcis]